MRNPTYTVMCLVLAAAILAAEVAVDDNHFLQPHVHPQEAAISLYKSVVEASGAGATHRVSSSATTTFEIR